MKAILFDFDGTLVDTQIWHNIAISKVLLEFNKKYTLDYCSDYFDGLCWQDLISEIALQENFDGEIVLNQAISLAEELILQNVKPNQGVVEVLEVLSKSDIKYAICSNSMTLEINLAMEKCGLKKFFSTNVFGRDCVKKGKPASDIYIFGMQKLNVLPHETFAVEDSLNGAKASIDAKIPTVIFSGASHFNEKHKKKFTVKFGNEIQFFSNMINAIEYMVYA